MGVLVLVEGNPPALELHLLRAGQEERLRERDCRRVMGTVRVDGVRAYRQPITNRRVVVDRTDPEERLERQEERAIPRRHCDLKPEPQPGAPIGEVLALRPDDEAAFAGDHSRQRVPDQSPNAMETIMRIGGAEGN